MSSHSCRVRRSEDQLFGDRSADVLQNFDENYYKMRFLRPAVFKK